MPCDLIMPPKHGALSDDDDQTISMTSPPRHASVVVELKATNDCDIDLLSRLLSNPKKPNHLDHQLSQIQQSIQLTTKPETSPKTNPTKSQPCPTNNNNNPPSSAATPNTSRAQQRYVHIPSHPVPYPPSLPIPIPPTLSLSNHHN